MRHDALAHAYAFVGPSDIGKTQVAETFAQILQCPNNFCRTCPTCIQVQKNIHSETLQLLDDGESIKISTIRELIERVNFTPQGRYKIVIIENLERLTPEASHALLKTLEEPPSRTIFITTLTDVQATLPTIISRMRVLNFKKPSLSEVRTALRELYPEVSDEQLELAISLSFGAGARTRALIEDPEKLSRIKQEFDHIAYLYEKGTLAERIMNTAEVAKEEGAAERFLQNTLHFLHQRLHSSLSNPAARMQIVKQIEVAQRALELLGKNINTRLLLEHLSINLVQ